jgi:radical SAM protein
VERTLAASTNAPRFEHPHDVHERHAGCTINRVMRMAPTLARTKFDERPFIAIWETTQACDLVCKHCRACAQPKRDRDELTTAEGKRLLDELADAKIPLVVLTGGDPAKRPDLLELVEHGARREINLGLTPSATPLVTNELVRELGQLGLSRLAISIDGPTPAIHDEFRGVRGSFAEAQRILNAARAAGLQTQINTSVHAGNIAELSSMARVVEAVGAKLWSVFFLVPTGRADAAMLPSAELVEQVMNELAELAEAVPFALKTTAAPHYRRVLAQRAKRNGSSAEHGVYGRTAVRINDGRGFVFVSHRGEIFPSGFLPLPCGNVRKDRVIEVYREHPTFVQLRDSHQLHGKCGACEYRNLCGGSRARAFALTGDYLESDELCAYRPHDYVEKQERRRLAVLNG